MPNRLASETSPYLLQHRNNPVDWYPWGAEAFARAREENRPILLSIGYSACHWCHVMERESFEDSDIAALMNDLFISVKVDREERPDVDSVYMSAVQRMTGQAGWPLTAILTPGGDPFYGGTYFPPTPRHGLPSFPQVLEAASQAYHDRREEVLSSSEALRRDLDAGARLQAHADRTGEDLLKTAADRVMSGFDPRHGGFGNAPKFPQPMVLEFLLRYWRRTGDESALRVVERTLDGMAAGGIYDHLGGGFHRYSVDARWLVPHFEKMLYDNALLARAYLFGFQVSGTAGYRRVVEDVLAYVEREMTSPEGAFYAAQDADTEGEEGRYFVWSAEEVDALLGDEDGSIFRRYYGITTGGNFEGRNVLHVARSAEAFATEAGIDPDRLEAILDRGRRRLLEARRERVAPGRDEKLIASWNGMMIRTFAEASRILDEPRYAEAAARAAAFILEEMRVDGVLHRIHKDGQTKISGFLEDHAALADGLHMLYEATFDRRWIREARALGDDIITRFWNPSERLFFDAPVGETDLIVRPRDPTDNATPSGNSLAIQALLRLDALLDEERYRQVAGAALENATGLVERAPSAFGQLLCALDQYVAAPREVAIIGDPDTERTRVLLSVLASRFNPEVVVALARPGEVDEVAEDIPLLAGRRTPDGSPTVFVCERFACQAPVSSPDDLANLLDRETLVAEWPGCGSACDG